jgi:hypothetical protein
MKTILLCLLMLVSIVGASFPAHAGMTGDEFLRAAPAYQEGFVSGVVRGMYLTCLDHLDARKQLCSFEPILDAAFDLTPDQVLKQFAGYLRKNADARRKDAAEALVDCLREIAHLPREGAAP